MIKTMNIKGFRGFSTIQKVDFAKPDGINEGSGLSIFVGSNNAGKSTILEAIRSITQSQKPSFSTGRRNVDAGDEIYIKIETFDNEVTELKSDRPGSSETKLLGAPIDTSKIFTLNSRRAFNPFFGKSTIDRNSYLVHYNNLPNQRLNSKEEFSQRLFSANENRDEFNILLEKIISPIPEWTIDLNDNGQYYLKFSKGSTSHSSEGVGEGLISLFFIIDALYDSSPGDVIVIDEPELSLHPSYQRKLANLLGEMSKDRQIIISTHSPYFVNLEYLGNKASIIRVYLENGSSVISQLDEKYNNFIKGVLNDFRNPHTLGINAREVFFLEDKIILVEGQEDIIFYEKVLKELNISINGNFFGWGIGGSDKMKKFASILENLGFKQVVGLLDGDKEDYCIEISNEFPNYKFCSIPADDVRTKKEYTQKEVRGLLDDKNQKIRSEYKTKTEALFNEIKSYLK